MTRPWNDDIVGLEDGVASAGLKDQSWRVIGNVLIAEGISERPTIASQPCPCFT